MLRIYNTLTRQKEEFKPIIPGKVSFYQCGPTVYWTQHIGNMRAMVCADLINRVLAHHDFDVTFVRNYTDVGHLTGDNLGDADSGEDRMDKGARREGKTPAEIAQKYIDIFEKDCERLNILPPAHKPRATKYISQMIEMIKTLEEKGHAYKTSKAVYFDVSTAKDYNKLNKQDMEKLQFGAGAGDVQDPEKKNPQDFALWFFKTGVHANALQTWDSPWGAGFPGWHIECSAMINSLLGKTIDVHMGGVEHISIHHTNEIAQSESANGVPLAKYWIHNEHLTVDGGKMGKSEGNAYTLSDVIDKGYDPLVLRYLFLQAHYRSKQNFTWEALDAAQTAYLKLQEATRRLGVEEKIPEDYEAREEYQLKFNDAENDDFNIPQALAVAWEVVKTDRLSASDKYSLLMEFDQVLGLDLDKIPAVLKFERTPQEVEELVRKRNEHRKANQYQEADKVRQEIEKLGYEVSDTTKFGSDVRKKR